MGSIGVRAKTTHKALLYKYKAPTDKTKQNKRKKKKKRDGAQYSVTHNSRACERSN
jgi:hypothetical protein